MKTKRAKGINATQLSLKELRRQGYLVEVVERWNFRTVPAVVDGKPRQLTVPQYRIDLLGFADLIAVSKSETVLVQTTSRSNLSSRRRKITADPELRSVARQWLTAPGRRIVLHGWHQPRGKGTRYELVIDELLLDDAAEPEAPF